MPGNPFETTQGFIFAQSRNATEVPTFDLFEKPQFRLINFNQDVTTDDYEALKANPLSIFVGGFPKHPDRPEELDEFVRIENYRGGFLNLSTKTEVALNI